MAGESGLSVPAVVNDVVLMATSRVALYAFRAGDGRLLWSDTEHFGPQTGGMSGGYGYCMGPASPATGWSPVPWSAPTLAAC